MPAKTQKPPEKGEKSQYQRFVETARKLDSDESGEAFERAFAKAVPPKRRDNR